MDGLPPTVDGQQHWVIGDRLAAGGFGEVFSATRLGEVEVPYVVKFVPIEPGAERELLSQAMPGIRNIVPLVDFGESGNKFFMVMPRAELSCKTIYLRRGVYLYQRCSTLDTISASPS